MKPAMSLRVRLLKSKALPYRNPNHSNNKLNKTRLSVLKRIIATICIVLFLYVLLDNHTAISELDQNPPFHIENPALDHVPPQTTRQETAKVKIYLYELPERFTSGVIERYWSARDVHREDLRYGTYPKQQHMAEWHLFSDLIEPRPERLGSPVVPVADPSEADLFFVPCFASLSVVADPAQRPEEDELVELAEWLESRPEWQNSGGRDHVMAAENPMALHGVMDRLGNSLLLVSDFGGSRADRQSSLLKDVVVPNSFRVSPFEGDLGVGNRTTLLFFVGARFCKECGKFRDSLFQVLETEVDVEIRYGIHSLDDPHSAFLGMHTSKFCLNPTGDTPSSSRLFDSIASFCVPVIVSDAIDLPFEDVIDYRKIAIFVETSMALTPGFLVTMLRKITAERILEFQKEMKLVRHYFEYGKPTVNEIWRQVVQKLPLIKLMVNRSKRHFRANGVPNRSCLCSNHSAIIGRLL